MNALLSLMIGFAFFVLFVAGIIKFLMMAHDSGDSNATSISNTEDKVDTSPKFNYVYNRRNSVVTPAELEFFRVLNTFVGDKYFIFPQMHLSTLLSHTTYGQNWKGALSHIDRKSVDFAICDKETMKPLLAIELDDHTHEYPDRQQRDAEVEEIFSNADLPLLRIRNNGSFSSMDIRKIVDEKITNL